MSYFKQALGNAKLAILALGFSLVLSFLLNIYLGFALFWVPKSMTVFVPPQIPGQGFHTKASQMSNSRVYAFTYYIWQSLQTWPNEGVADYKNNLKALSPYLTLGFKNTLVEDAKKQYEAGFLYKHQQLTFGVAGTAFEPRDVNYRGHGTWLVHLTMRAINSVSPPDDESGFESSHVASDAVTSFVFKVVQIPVSQKNKWGLAMDGFASPPEQLKTLK